MTNILFYIPFLYRYQTREKGKYFLPLIMTDFLPPLILCTNIFTSFSLTTLLIYLFAFLGMFDFYEIGYILNDAVTVKNEKKPTLRLNDKQMQHYSKYCMLIFGLRLIYFMISSILLFFFEKNLTYFLLLNLILLISYCFHNYIRNKFRYFTNSLLNMAKYFIPVIFFNTNSNLTKFMVFFFLFPFFRSITYGIEREIKKLNTDSFIFVFYLFALLVLIGLRKFTANNIDMPSILFIAIFCLYRLLCLIKRKKYLN